MSLHRLEKSRKEKSVKAKNGISADELYDYFINKLVKLVKQMKKCHPSGHNIGSIANFFLALITNVETLTIIRNLKNSSCVDFYDISTNLIKHIY